MKFKRFFGVSACFWALSVVASTSVVNPKNLNFELTDSVLSEIVPFDVLNGRFILPFEPELATIIQITDALNTRADKLDIISYMNLDFCSFEDRIDEMFLPVRIFFCFTHSHVLGFEIALHTGPLAQIHRFQLRSSVSKQRH